MVKLKLTKESGFTLIEALVGLLILTVALVPAAALSRSSVSLAASIRNNLIASMLAQEGIEVVKNIRDANWTNDQPFNYGLTDESHGTEGQYEVQWDDDALRAPGYGYLCIDATGMYSYDPACSSSPTQFRRVIQLTQIGSASGDGEGIRIVSEVSWRERNRNRSVTVESLIFNWR